MIIISRYFKKIVCMFCCIFILSPDLVSAAVEVKSMISNESDLTKESEIKIEGINDKEIEVGSSFDKMEGVTAKDSDGKDISESITVEGDVDTNNIGEYTVKYFAKDDNGKIETIDRKIKVIDKSKEVLSVNDTIELDNLTNITIPINSSFDPFADITSTNIDIEDIKSKVSIEGDLDLSKEGEYNLKYNYKNSQGNMVSENRRVVVIDSHNIINIYTNKENKDLMFSVVLNNKDKQLELVNKLDEYILDKKLDEYKKIFELKIFDKDNKEKYNFDIFENDENISEKLKMVENISYNEEDTISVYHINPKQGINIIGKIEGDVELEKEDYIDGVDNEDYIKNVRFKIIEGKLESIYNNAPEIQGLSEEVYITGNLDSVKIVDDHDGIIPNDKIQIEEKDIENSKREVTYKIEDSWGRATAQVLTVDKARINVEKSTISTMSNTEENTPSNISDNTITVKGISFAGVGDERFKIKFRRMEPSDAGQIIVEDQDGRIMSTKDINDYFSIKIYDTLDSLMAEVNLKASDRSSSKALDKIKNLRVYEGYYIEIHHAEANTKLQIGGKIVDSNGQIVQLSNGIKELISGTKFKVQSTGLVLMKNDPPTITKKETFPATIDRGSDIDLKEHINITDDRNEIIDPKSVKVEGFDPNEMGQQEVTFSVADSWGKVGTLKENITVKARNDIDNFKINVKSKDGTLDIFKIYFNDIKKIIEVKDQTENSIDSKSKDITFSLNIYNSLGSLKKNFTLKGYELGNIDKVSLLNGYMYSEGDYISIYSKYPDKAITIDGNIKRNDSSYPQNDSSEDYSDGIQDTDYMSNVRFQLKDGNITSFYNKAPTFEGMNEVTIKRGDDFKPMSGVSVNDDHDNTISNDKVTHNYNQDMALVVGEYNIKYKVTDSWGREGTHIRKLIVEPTNELEYNVIDFMAQNGSRFLQLNFDTITKTLTANYDRNKYIQGNIADNALVLKLYGGSDNLNPKDTITLKYGQIIDEDFIKKLTSIQVEEGDTLSIWYYDKDKVSIKGDMITPKSIYVYGFKSDDIMKNTRFKVTTNGLDDLYNEAPTFDGVEELIVSKGSEVDLLYGVSVRDDHDNDNGNGDKIISGIKINGFVIDESNKNVTLGTIGRYTITYSYTDSWGRKAQKDRTIRVVKKTKENIIKLENGNDKNIFEIRFTENDRFDVIKNTKLPENTLVENEQDEAVTQQGEPSQGEDGQLEVEQPDDTPQSDGSTEENKRKNEFEIHVFNREGKKVKSIELQDFTEESLNKLDELKNVNLDNGYRIALKAKKHQNLKIEGPITKDEQIEERDYSKGIENEDYMNNVRFEITDDGLNAIYNQAPKINFNDKRIMGLSRGATHDYLQDVKVTDDHDNVIDNSKVTVKEPDWTNFDTPQNITYTVIDSWGRVTTKERQVIVTNGMLRNVIHMKAHPDASNVYNPAAYPTGLKIVFDVDSKQIKLEERNNNKFFGSYGSKYFTIKIYHKDSDSTTKYQATVTGKEASNNQVFDNLNGLQFEYGDKIELWSHHPYKIAIEGEVVDGREDYSDGIDQPTNILNAKFEITEDGLKSIYNEKENINNNGFLIKWLSREGYTFKMEGRDLTNETTEGNNKKLYLSERRSTLQFEPWKKKENAFYMRYEKADENNEGDNRNSIANVNNVKEVQLNGDGTLLSINNGSLSFTQLFDNHQYKNGDFLMFKYGNNKVEYPKRLIIEGNITGDVTKEMEDYSDGIDNDDYLYNVKFKFVDGGLETIYNKAPQITGVEDIDIIQGTRFDPRYGVDVLDDKDLSLSIKDVIIDDSTLNVVKVGEYTVTYQVTDSWGRTTLVERKVNVRPRVWSNKIEIYSDEDNNNPLFYIGMNNKTGKYTVEPFMNGQLSTEESLQEENVFEISITKKTQNTDFKTVVTLNGKDTAQSSKLDVISQLEYSEGDIIRVWRTDGSRVRIDGHLINGELQEINFRDGIPNEKLKNIGFEFKLDGLKSLYNEEPQIDGLEDNKYVLYEDTSFTLTNGITVTDDKDGDITVTEEIVTDDGGFDVNRIGSYDVTYQVTDSWGRTTSRTVRINVVPRVVENRFDIYGKNSSGAEENKFSIVFDPHTAKYQVKIGKGITELDSSSSGDTAEYVKITIYDRFGQEKKKISLNGKDRGFASKLNELNEISYELNDMVSIIHKEHAKVKISGNIISNTSRSAVDYSNGFNSAEDMNTTRFTVLNEGLKETKRTEPTMNGLTDIQTTRGTVPDLKTGISVKHSTEIITMDKVTISELDVMTLGEKTVNYSFTDSWGKTESFERKVTVIDRGPLEKNIINLKDNVNNNTMLSIGFDEVEMKLHAQRKATSTFSASEPRLRIELYSASGTLKAELDVDRSNYQEENTINEINNTEFTYGDMIKLISYDSSKGLSIEGEIKEQKEPYDDGVQNSDYIENVRFEITENGLKSQYNEAPVISELASREIYSDTHFDLLDGVTVTDDRDKIIDSNLIEITPELDTNKLGAQTLTYSVTDSWGRTSSKTREIYVRSKAEQNKFEFYSEDGNRLVFSLSIDSETNKFKLSKPTDRSVVKDIYPRVGKEPAIVIKFYDKNGNEKNDQRIELTGENTDYSKLDKINSYSYEYGDYIGLDVKNHKQGIKITNGVTVLNGDDENSVIEDYSNGVDDKRNLENVRFLIDQSGIVAIYNKAPEVSKKEDVDFSIYKGDEVDYIQFFNIKDDHDRINDLKISTDDNLSEIGAKKISVTVTDSWGRSTTIEKVDITIKNGLERNRIIVLKDYKGNEGSKGLNIVFDWANKKMKLDQNNFSGTLNGGPVTYFTLTHKNADNSVTDSMSLRGSDYISSAAKTFFNWDDRTKENGRRFEYGDRLKVYLWHPKKWTIQGKVNGAKEDYSDGVDYAYNLTDVEFEITDEGLKVVNVYGDIKDGVTNVIAPVAAEGYPFKLKIDATTRTLTVTDRYGYKIESGATQPRAFEIALYNKDNQLKINPVTKKQMKETLNAGSTGLGNTFDNYTYEYGDYFVLYHFRNKKITINGKIKDAREDYTDGVDAEQSIETVKFELINPNENDGAGLKAIYNDPPVISGNDLIKVERGTARDEFDVKSGITVIDPEDGKITQNIKIHDDRVNLEVNGLYDVVFKVKDSGNNIEYFNRPVLVYSASTIELKPEVNTTIELGTLDHLKTEENKREALKRLVNVYDEEDGIGIVNELQIEGVDKFNPSVEGSYNITYKVTDSHDNTTVLNVTFNVVKTISVDVPLSIPFQVVTNLLAKDIDPFISGVMKIKNNRTSNVSVYIDNFTKKENSGELKIVDPKTVENWDDLNSEETMNKMALGIYSKSGLENSKSNDENNAIWLSSETAISKPIYLGNLSRKATVDDESTEARFGFTSKYGKSFIGGSNKGKFELRFRFE